MALIHPGVIQILNQPKMIADISSRTVQASHNGQLEGNSKRQRTDQPATASAMPVCDGQRLQTKATGVGGKASVAPCVRRTSGADDIFNLLSMHRRYCCSLTHGSPVPEWMCAVSKDLWTAAFQKLSALLCLVAASGPSG